MSFLLDVLPEVEAKLSAEARRESYRTDPVLWAEEFLGIKLWKKQREILESIRDNHNTAVAAGHSVGKSFIASVAMAWWADVHPLEQVKILSTAPTFNQVTSILWDNLRKWHLLTKQRHEEYKRRVALGTDLGEYRYNDHPLPGNISSTNIWKTDDGFEIGFGRKPPDNLLDSAFQGIHAPYLLVIGDEAAGLPEELVDALGNNATGSANRILLIANPTDPTSAMAKIWREKEKGANWTRMNISVYDSPTVTNEPGFDIGEDDGMSGWGYINEKIADWGEDDPRFISRVKGEWAFDSGNNLFTDTDLARAANTVVLPDPEALIHFGCDVAGNGPDYSVVYMSRIGEVWTTNEETGAPVERTGVQGLHVRLLDFWNKAPTVSRDPENLGTAQRIHAHALAESAAVVMIDAAAFGKGVVDGVRDLNEGQYTVVEVYGSSPASDARAYLNARAENYFELKRKMFAGELDLDGKDTRLFDELRSVVYEHTDNNALKIESKESMKRRGVKSPDFADALWYAAMDVSPLIDGPLAGVKPGDRLEVNPYDMLDDEVGMLDGLGAYGGSDALASAF